MYRTQFYVNMYGSYKLLKTVRFFGPPCIILILLYCSRKSVVVHRAVVWVDVHANAGDTRYINRLQMTGKMRSGARPSICLTSPLDPDLMICVVI